MNALKRVRLEPFGAWVALDDATLVAVDRPRALSLGLDGGALWETLSSEARAPLEVHVAVTSRCAAGCVGCYQSATRDGDEVPREELEQSLDLLAAMGVFTVAFGGGEPLSRSDLGALGESARSRGLIPVVTTSGIGLSPERAKSLRAFAQVNVSHDGVGGGYLQVRGFEGASIADRAIETLTAQGIPVGVNHVLTRDNFHGLGDTVVHIKNLGARELQLLRYKPAGRAASAEYLRRRLSPEQVRALGAVLNGLVEAHGEKLSIRVDCAMIPLLSETLTDAAAMTRFGVFGCEAAGHLGALRRDGSFAGCSFHTSDPEAPRASEVAWQNTPGLKAFREYVSHPMEPCASCPVRSVCRGGCKVVSEHLRASFGPDPECPRVISHGASSHNNSSG